MQKLLVILPLLLCLVMVAIDGLQLQNEGLSIEAIYQFGDSISDTGNLVRENPNPSQRTAARLPYGINFHSHQPSGRFSDGFLIVDYIAKFLDLPFVEPFLKKDGNFDHGVNFAVMGATALDPSTLAARDISLSVTNTSLSVQLGWFKSHLASICSTSSTDCEEKLRKALFIIGEIGGNDLNNAVLEGNTMEDLRKLVPDIVQEIKTVVNEVINLGAAQVIVPGNFPMGCMTIYLARFSTDDPSMYDELKCLKIWNELARFQNEHLKHAVRELQEEHPHAKIVYADYYEALRAVIRNASSLGFDEEQTQNACCGSPDDTYNFNLSRLCGYEGTQACQNPEYYISWDGIHLTSHAYKHVFKFLLKDIISGFSFFGRQKGGISMNNQIELRKTYYARRKLRYKHTDSTKH